MVSQDNGKPIPSITNVSSDIGDFVQDMITLVELQAQLFVSDVRECIQRGFAPALVMLCGVAMGIACLPIGLTALALLLVQVFDWSYISGFLTAFAVGAVVGVLLTIAGWFQIRKQLSVFRRSQHEFVRNLHWVKTVLKRNRVTRKPNSSDSSWRTKS